MGQRTSRLRPDDTHPSQPSHHLPPPQETNTTGASLRSPSDSVPGELSHQQAATSPDARSRRTAPRTLSNPQPTKRRSFLGSLRGHRSPPDSPSNSGSVRSRLDSTATEGGSRRRWLMSKRRNTSAPRLDAGDAGEVERAGLPIAPSVGSSNAMHTGKEREEGTLSTNAVAGSSTSAVTFPTPQPSSVSLLEAVTDTDDEEDSPSPISEVTAVPPPTQAGTPFTQRAPARAFPPAGTLVVVQGVVHTSDVAPAYTSAPPAQARDDGRRATSVPASSERRLSTLLTRPMRSRRSSYISPDSASSSDAPISDPLTAHTSSRMSEDSRTAASSPEPRVPVLSPTSIDVLGTLLSVATAATAASLVTGSSDPLFSSGLALPGVAPAPPSEASRPMSPTPTAGLGGLGNLSVPPAPQSSRDRMRNAWSSIRDRFGLNNRHASPEQTPAPSPPPPSTGNAGNTEGADPRTQLLAEMARAFHLGMGLDNPDGSNANAAGAAPAPASTPTADTVLDAERPMPPEDSFERFLIDLQTDLRRTLADDHSPTSPANTDRPPSPTTEDMPPAIYPLYERIPSAGDEPGIGDDDLPPLADGSDSDIDELEHVEVHDAQEDVESTHGQEGNAPQNAASIPIIGAHTASGSERRPGGGINWWRMYRFPPMTVPANQAQSSPALPTSLPATLASAASPLPVLTPLNHATATSAQTSATTTGVSEGTPSSDGETNIIVPVIVVGLQSVNGTNAQRGTHEDPTLAQGEEGLFAGHSHGEDPSDHDHDDMPAEDDRGHADMDNERADTPTNGARGRSWHSRAADRLRGMRNRRTSNAETRQNEGNGSTTFFIYVIGGYYPPNHHLVTGTDPLDSFEALWELAELLGQVKPPTATKEDIDNSGLEVIHAHELERYEKDGRVAPMCVERCLICLEDYAPQEDLRLMSCRHLFHKNCVDRWLETGRNNCPACRSQGVSTEAGATETPAA